MQSDIPIYIELSVVMEIKQLKTFVVVAETLSFSRTAEILNFAQSSISD